MNKLSDEELNRAFATLPPLTKADRTDCVLSGAHELEYIAISELGVLAAIVVFVGWSLVLGVLLIFQL